MPVLPSVDDRYTGIFGVTVTPFTADGLAIDEGALRDLVTRLLDDGVDRLVPNGNTGEYHTLSVAERRRAAEITLDAARGRARLVVVGVAGAIEDAIAAARHAADHGADAVMVHHPVHPYVTPEGLIEYLSAIAAGSPIPIVPYLKTPLDEAAARRLATIRGVVAVKWGVNDLPAFAAAVAATRDTAVRWICGTAEMWAPFYWAVGATGFTSGLVNVTAGRSQALLEALNRGDRDETMRLWSEIRPFEALRAKRGDGWNVAVVKAAMRIVGRPAGPVRAPSSDVGEAEIHEITRLLAGWGVERDAPSPGFARAGAGTGARAGAVR
jgi:4-hydroxy-tetrahydrodipicolinate synthase